MKPDFVKRQWNEAAKSWVRFVREGKDYYREYLNGPALKQMMGEVEGKKVLDIACGEGYFSRFFAKAGAKVTGIDISDSLVNEAVEEEKKHPLGVKYFVADAANLSMLESGSFDFAFCFMALMDMQDYEGAVSEASRLLKMNGSFVAVIEHPCFVRHRVLNGKTVCDWKKRTGEGGSEKWFGVYYWISDYFTRHSYVSEWKHSRLQSSFVTTGFHRTLSDYVNAMTKSGLVITKFDEPQPLEQGVRLHSPMEKHYRIPHSIIIKAIKTLSSLG
ncbi:MAG TPA: class I SAM-dependent methyltransferase [Candidatus Bathyarchaeia archaeon]|jgi:SAM-dependent methyltransferase|nr:class I SAM-dependent methyltransferase [Candidatus Bathyarchaeia archaeon]